MEFHGLDFDLEVEASWVRSSQNCGVLVSDVSLFAGCHSRQLYVCSFDFQFNTSLNVIIVFFPGLSYAQFLQSLSGLGLRVIDTVLMPLSEKTILLICVHLVPSL